MADCPCYNCPRNSDRACDYGQCTKFRSWFLAAWKHQQKALTPKPKVTPPVWRYESPMLLHDYFDHSPCERCASRSHCCRCCDTYARWFSLRWRITCDRLRRF